MEVTLKRATDDKEIMNASSKPAVPATGTRLTLNDPELYHRLMKECSEEERSIAGPVAASGPYVAPSFVTEYLKQNDVRPLKKVSISLIPVNAWRLLSNLLSRTFRGHRSFPTRSTTAGSATTTVIHSRYASPTSRTSATAVSRECRHGTLAKEVVHKIDLFQFPSGDRDDALPPAEAWAAPPGHAAAFSPPRGGRVGHRAGRCST